MIGFIHTFWRSCAALILVSCVHGPSATIESAAYASQLEACAVYSTTCEAYVECRVKVAKSHGRAYAGRCLP